MMSPVSREDRNLPHRRRCHSESALSYKSLKNNPEKLESIKEESSLLTSSTGQKSRKAPRRRTGLITGLFILISWSLAMTIAVIILASRNPKCKDPCPDNWLLYKGKCYYISDEVKYWETSEEFCSQQDALLAVIENKEELNFIEKLACRKDAWIGLHKTKGKLFWVNGTALNTSLLEVKGSGECAYVETNIISTSGCTLPRNWMCKKKPE